MKKVLVTGAGGLVGFHLVSQLKSNYQVITLGRTPIEGVQHISIDFSEDWDYQDLPKDIEVVIHLAQSANFRDFPNAALEVFNVNTLSTLKLAKFAQETGVGQLIYASSGGVYGNAMEGLEEDQAFKTDDTGFYIGTKMSSELILEGFRSLFDVVQVRFFFVYGKGQNSGMLVPRLIENIRAGNKINLLGEKGLLLNPIHVEDACRAIQGMIGSKNLRKINVGGPEVLSLKEMAETIGKAANNQVFFDIKEGKSSNLIGNIDKLKNEVFEPKISFEEGIKSMVE